MPRDWKKDLQPRFAELRARRGLDSLAVAIGASRASIDRWSRGLAEPLPIYSEAIERVVEEAETSHVRRRGGMG